MPEADGKTQPKWPEVKVKIVEREGNGWSIIARVALAMERANIDPDEIQFYRDNCQGSYDHLIEVTRMTVSCE